MKYLSVIIPFYNSATTLEKAAMSCLDSRVLDDIEVIMVNDGSKDNSIEIAKGIEHKFPNSVKVIDKLNGGKGSCINIGLIKATGKYVRELDSDDYFVSDSIFQLIGILKSLKSDVDVIHTNYVFEYIVTGKKVTAGFSKSSYKTWNLLDDKLPEFCYQNYQMHALSYRLEFLKKIEFRQSEGISYTDTEYIYYPLSVDCHVFF